ncbi:signal peptidase II [Sphingomonas sp. BIUV-7]|uniref:Lipoprotein signal peptidase n=1 Tax=Sphingomonas natans TaxID=3063330 RepID=A0ABT8Y4J9_9SPHN|nr:signal peptidase II [Sphingomonas sp. BIUV-7]MDO6413242.1 signal peptidase II [Sphingomonas sp. BIUV-7]
MPARVAGFLTALIVLLADQITKWIIIGPIALPARGPVDLLPIFRLIWVENYGVSMGFLVAGSTAERWLLTAVTAAIAIGVLVWLLRERNRIDALALGSILGGAIGNIGDRVRLGYVADFLNLHFGAWSPFLVFNVADAAISVGVVLLAVRALFVRDASPAEKENV